MGYRERQWREQNAKIDADPKPGAATAMSLVGQLLWQGAREEKRKWYGLLVFLPRFYLTLRFNRRLREGLARMTAAQRLGGTEVEVAQEEFKNEFMAFLVEKKLVRPD